MISVILGACDSKNTLEFNHLAKSFAGKTPHTKFIQRCQPPPDFNIIVESKVSCIEFTKDGYFEQEGFQSFIDSTFNTTYGWKYRGDGKTVDKSTRKFSLDASRLMYERIFDNECNLRLFITYDKSLMDREISKAGSKIYITEPKNLFCGQKRTIRTPNELEIIERRKEDPNASLWYIEMNVGNPVNHDAKTQ